VAVRWRWLWKKGGSIVEGFMWAGLELNDENCDGEDVMHRM
jgi:hypothetical protein